MKKIDSKENKEVNGSNIQIDFKGIRWQVMGQICLVRGGYQFAN
jgi:hypothetical protein